MDASQSLDDLVAAARENAAAHESTIANALATEANEEEQQAAIIEIERLTVDIYSVFEARMQHHFKRGPFSRKLNALLIGAGQPDLAKRIYTYYLAVNVLKHGIGASHRELKKSPTALFDLKPFDPDNIAGSLIDVSAPGFFDGLCTTIVEAQNFLER